MIRTPKVKSPEWWVLSVPKAVPASLPPGAGRTFPQLPQKLTGSDNTPASRLGLCLRGRGDGKGFHLPAEIVGPSAPCVVSEQLLETLSPGPTADW